MKTIYKLVTIIIRNFIGLFVCSFILDNMGRFVAKSFSVRESFIFWWDDFYGERTFIFLIATALLSGIICLIYNLALHYVVSGKTFIIAIIAGCVCILAFTILYWRFIQIYFYEREWSRLESAFSISFGNNKSQISFWVKDFWIIFLGGIITNGAEVFIQNRIQKITWHQVYYYDNFFDYMLYIIAPYIILLSGNFFFVGYIKIKVKELYVIFAGIYILHFFISNTISFVHLYKYYLGILNESTKLENFVVVQESPYVNKSFFVKYINQIKKLENIKENKILFIPYEMGIETDDFIKLDVYDESIFISLRIQAVQMYSSMSKLRGTFNLAFYFQNVPSPLEYDGKFNEFKNLLNKITYLEGYLNYKREVDKELNKLNLTDLTKLNLISKEILEFKKHMEEIVSDDFLSFDYAIKWLEVVNYLYALVAISKCDFIISDKIYNLLENADFGKWREIVKKLLNYDNDMKKIIMKRKNEMEPFCEFEKIWYIVTSRQYIFEQYNVDELLYGAKELRNYTRGHGVFTFEITKELNISLIKILIFIINKLIECLDMADNLDNLEKNGWVLYSGDIPYYLYSIDKINKKYKYESFQKGNTISLPLDR